MAPKWARNHGKSQGNEENPLKGHPKLKKSHQHVMKTKRKSTGNYADSHEHACKSLESHGNPCKTQRISSTSPSLAICALGYVSFCIFRRHRMTPK
jgi:hypothetical protein